MRGGGGGRPGGGAALWQARGPGAAPWARRAALGCRKASLSKHDWGGGWVLLFVSGSPPSPSLVPACSREDRAERLQGPRAHPTPRTPAGAPEGAASGGAPCTQE